MKILSSLLQTQATVHLQAVLWIRICPDPYSIDPSRSVFGIRIRIQNPDPYLESGSVFKSGTVFRIRISIRNSDQYSTSKPWYIKNGYGSIKNTGYIKNYYGSGYRIRIRILIRIRIQIRKHKKEYGSPTLPVRNRQKILLNIY